MSLPGSPAASRGLLAAPRGSPAATPGSPAASRGASAASRDSLIRPWITAKVWLMSAPAATTQRQVWLQITLPTRQMQANANSLAPI
eukprot:3506140-Pleurochrysis_carterae.AAC.1